MAGALEWCCGVDILVDVIGTCKEAENECTG